MEPDLTGAIPVASVAQEYEELRSRRCPCGGQLRLAFQALVAGPQGGHYDLMLAECRACGAEQRLVFDISSFYGHNASIPGP